MTRKITWSEFRALYEEGMISDTVVWIERGKSYILARNVKGQAMTPKGYEVVEVESTVASEVGEVGP